MKPADQVRYAILKHRHRDQGIDVVLTRFVFWCHSSMVDNSVLCLHSFLAYNITQACRSNGDRAPCDFVPGHSSGKRQIILVDR